MVRLAYKKGSFKELLNKLVKLLSLVVSCHLCRGDEHFLNVIFKGHIICNILRKIDKKGKLFKCSNFSRCHLLLHFY